MGYFVSVLGDLGLGFLFLRWVVPLGVPSLHVKNLDHLL